MAQRKKQNKTKERNIKKQLRKNENMKTTPLPLGINSGRFEMPLKIDR